MTEKRREETTRETTETTRRHTTERPAASREGETNNVGDASGSTDAENADEANEKKD